MFHKSHAYYDAIYSFKNYAEEATKIADLIRAEHPQAKTVLDVACGTAEHAKLLREDFAVDGIDLEPGFIDLARSKVPTGTFTVADMRCFELGKRYDVVQCLFSSIGYLLEISEVIETLRRFRRHLSPGGIVVVEPWFTPSAWTVGIPWMTTVDQPKLKICRMNISERDGTISRMRFHYLIAQPAGVEHFEEEHRLALYTVDQMRDAFTAAELSVQHDPVGIFGRGLYVGRAA